MKNEILATAKVGDYQIEVYCVAEASKYSFGATINDDYYAETETDSVFDTFYRAVNILKFWEDNRFNDVEITEDPMGPGPEPRVWP